MTLERLQAVKKSTNFKFRLEEENRLDMLANETLNSHLKISLKKFLYMSYSFKQIKAINAHINISFTLKIKR